MQCSTPLYIHVFSPTVGLKTFHYMTVSLHFVEKLLKNTADLTTLLEEEQATRITEIVFEADVRWRAPPMGSVCMGPFTSEWISVKPSLL